MEEHEWWLASYGMWYPCCRIESLLFQGKCSSCARRIRYSLQSKLCVPVLLQSGLREAVTEDIDTRNAYFIRFYIRVGSSSSSGSCDYGDSSSEGVLLQFSSDGGITWQYLSLYSYYSYRNKIRIALLLPSAALGPAVRFRWWQPYHSGTNQDEWAIDNVYIGGRKTPARHLSESFDPITDIQWLFTPSGSIAKYCQSSSNTLQFTTGTDGAQHDAITQNVLLSHGDIIQFEV